MKIFNIFGKELLEVSSLADLRNANLAAVDLRYAALRNADLLDANLLGADFQDADLRYADLRDAKLQGVNFTGADLRYADLQHANLLGADLRGAKLRFANLRFAGLHGANLSFANLSFADLRYADLENANLTNIKFNNCVGNNKEIKSLQLGTYFISFSKLNIGCETYTIDEWLSFDRAELTNMHEGALDFKDKWGDTLAKIINLTNNT